MPAFREDLEAAREDVSRLRANKPDAKVCSADMTALSDRPY